MEVPLIVVLVASEGGCLASRDAAPTARSSSTTVTAPPERASALIGCLHATNPGVKDLAD